MIMNRRNIGNMSRKKLQNTLYAIYVYLFATNFSFHFLQNNPLGAERLIGTVRCQ